MVALLNKVFSQGITKTLVKETKSFTFKGWKDGAKDSKSAIRKKYAKKKIFVIKYLSNMGNGISGIQQLTND